MVKKFWSLLLSMVLSVSIAVAFVSIAKIIVNSGDEWENSEPVKLTEIGSPFKHEYDGLSEMQKHAYNTILKNVYSMPKRIAVPDISESELREVIYALLSDNPDLYFMLGNFTYEKYVSRTVCEIAYSMTPEEYRKAQAEIESVCRKVISGLSDPDDQWQTELEIHDYIVDSCKYEFVEEEGHKYSTAYSALVTGVTACEGYSKAAKMLFDEVGIESMTVSGEAVNAAGETERHMWNIVKIDGGYYHLDCTWNDPVSSGSEDYNEILKNMRCYDYFNLSDEMIKETHVPDKEYVECTSTEGYYYIKTEKYFDVYNGETEDRIFDRVSQAIRDGEEYVKFIFSNKEAYELAVRELGTNGGLNLFFKSRESSTDKKFVKNNLWHNPEDLSVTAVIEYELL